MGGIRGGSFWLVALLVGNATPVTAQQAPPPSTVAKAVSAVRIAEPIRVDGLLDETAWDGVAPATDFVQQQPHERRPAVHRTEVRFLYDATTLYVGGLLYDEAPQRAITNELRRDFQEPNNDLFGVVLDTFQDRRTSYGFVTNPGGAQRETLAYDQGERNDASWNAIWIARTAVIEDGWSVEMAIPFKALRFFEAPEQHWGLNLIRVVRRDNEVATWSPVPRQFTQYHVDYAGMLEGIAGVRGGRNLRVTPFATTQAGRNSIDAPWQSDADGGADVKWAITPSLVLDGTYRTDFAQVEADQVLINLTRFNLRFPEKRQFFLESPGSFQIGLTANQAGLIPYFTRRIGLADNGTPIPVIGGARLTGQAGGTTIGLLSMQTERQGERPGDNFTAVRLSRPAGRGVTLGGYYFGREAIGTGPASGAHNRVAGGDVRFSPSRTFEMDALVMRSESDGPEDDWTIQSGLRLRANQPRGRLSFLQVGDRFRHDLGFVQRTGVGMVVGDYSAIFRPRATYKWVREYELRMEAQGVADTGYHHLLTRYLRPSFLMQFADGGQFRTSLENNVERLTEPFALRRNIGSRLAITTSASWCCSTNRRAASASLSYCTATTARSGMATAGGGASDCGGVSMPPLGERRVRSQPHHATGGCFQRAAGGTPARLVADDTYVPERVRSVQRAGRCVAVEYPFQPDPSAAERHLRRLEQRARCGDPQRGVHREVHPQLCILSPHSTVERRPRPLLLDELPRSLAGDLNRVEVALRIRDNLFHSLGSRVLGLGFRAGNEAADRAVPGTADPDTPLEARVRPHA